MQLHEVESVFEQLWPRTGAEDWDAPGFSVSVPNEISHVLLTVDVTGAVVAEAETLGAQLILSHHPFLLKGTNNINWDDLKGNVLQHSVRTGISIFSAHTNADIVPDGVSDTLAKLIRLQDVRPLVGEGQAGHGRVGTLSEVMSLSALVELLVNSLDFSARGVSASGDPDAQIRNVALCAGAGDAFIAEAFESGADVYITSDLRHHVALDAIQRPRADQPFALIDISHWAAESAWLKVARTKLEELLPSVKFSVSEVVTDPWSFSVNRRSE